MEITFITVRRTDVLPSRFNRCLVVILLPIVSMAASHGKEGNRVNKPEFLLVFFFFASERNKRNFIVLNGETTCILPIEDENFDR